MSVSLYQILTHTPLWVWALLAFLIYRGLNAMQPRMITPSRALILPLVFLVWGLSGLINSRSLVLDLALALFVVGALVGLAAGSALATLTPAPRLDQQAGALAMPGSPIPLAMIVTAFVIKYVGAVALAMASDPATQAEIAGALALIGGAFAGLFWGRTLALFRRALLGAGASADWAALARLAFARGAP
jgi:multisubunit Na+/H+ antiporter MnhC subunit